MEENAYQLDLLAAVEAAVGTISGGIPRYATKRLCSLKFLQISTFWLSNALFQLEFIRIVAQGKIAGSSPVGHPPWKVLFAGKMRRQVREPGTPVREGVIWQLVGLIT